MSAGRKTVLGLEQKEAFLELIADGQTVADASREVGISPDTMRTIISRSKRGKIDSHKSLYSRFMEERKKARLNYKKLNKKRGKKISCAFLYFLAIADRGTIRFVKIGVSQNIKKRQSALQIGSPLKIFELFKMKFTHRAQALKEEARLHEIFSQFKTRVGNEWFVYSDEIRKHVESSMNWSG